MANHAYVKTKKKMLPEAITALINRLNDTVFKKVLKIECENYRGDSHAWGKYVWNVSYDIDGKEADGRIFWLNNSKSFEIRHGGGWDFIWWIDHVITNEVALIFDGIISDDGGSDDWKGEPNKYSSFEEYWKNIWGHRSDEAGKLMIKESLFYVPPEFQIDIRKGQK